MNLKTSGRKRKAFWSLGLFSFLAWSWILVSTEWLGYCYLILPSGSLRTEIQKVSFGECLFYRGIAVWDFPSWSHHWWFCVCSGTSRGLLNERKLPTDYSEAVLTTLERALLLLLALPAPFPWENAWGGILPEIQNLGPFLPSSWALGDSGWPGFHYLEGPVLFNSLCPLPPCFPLLPSAAFWLSSQDQRSREAPGYCEATVNTQGEGEDRDLHNPFLFGTLEGNEPFSVSSLK